MSGTSNTKKYIDRVLIVDMEAKVEWSEVKRKSKWEKLKSYKL